jgi:hypothetical protein
MRWLRYLGYALGGILLAGCVAFLVAAWIYRDIPAGVLEAKYTTPASRFLNVDGVRIHYRDEGSGPPLVLIHANFASLLSWDDAVESLKNTHRILRFDMTGHGLTGPDPSWGLQSRAYRQIDRQVRRCTAAGALFDWRHVAGRDRRHALHGRPPRTG